jgi:hypothetical protein
VDFKVWFWVLILGFGVDFDVVVDTDFGNSFYVGFDIVFG